MVNYGTMLLIVIFAIIGGIIAGALYTILNIMWNERKAKREFKEGKAFEVKKTPTQKIKQKRLRVPEPKEEIKKEEVPEPKEEIKEEPKPKEKPNYKEDFKKFQKANKELEKLKKEHEKGNLSYQELKEKFEYYQNQDYYKNILKDYGKN